MRSRTFFLVLAVVFAAAAVGALFAGREGRLYVITSSATALAFGVIGLRMPRASAACPSCGARHATGLVFCSECGADLPRRGG